MADPTLEQLERQIQTHALAAIDMGEVIAAIDALEQEAENGPLCRALETAYVATYARPFTKTNKQPCLSNKWVPRAGTPERELHDQLILERRQRYAHTDPAGQRLILHRGDIETGFDGLAEMIWPPDRARLPLVRTLAGDLHDRLLAKAFELQAEIVRLATT